MLSNSKYPEHITKEASLLLQSVNSGENISFSRISKLLKELTGEKKPKKDHRQILESSIK